MIRRILGIAASMAMLLSLIAISPVAAGLSASTVVDDDGFGTATDCNDAATPAWMTIQEGVDAAAAGGTVTVCPGTYVESVTVDKANLRLVGSYAGMSAESCAPRTGESIVTSPDGSASLFLNADGIRVNGFRITGSALAPGIQTTPDFSGYQILNNVIDDNVFGIYLQADGRIATQVARNCIFDNNRDGSASGDGIYTDAGLQNAGINNNTFSGHGSSAIVLIGGGFDASNIRVINNQSVDDSTFLVEVFVRKLYVAGDSIRSAAPDLGTAFYLYGGTAITITANSVVGVRSYGVYVDDSTDGVVISYNLIKRAGTGIFVKSAEQGAVNVRYNRIRNVTGDGILMGKVTNENHLSGNRITGSGGLDCHDLSTGPATLGTANSWVRTGAARNIGLTSDPVGLCATS